MQTFKEYYLQEKSKPWHKALAAGVAAGTLAGGLAHQTLKDDDRPIAKNTSIKPIERTHVKSASEIDRDIKYKLWLQQLHNKTPQTTTASPKPAIKQGGKIDDFVGAIIKHEGVTGGKTPMKITNHTMRTWDNLLGYPIDKEKTNTSGFIHLKNPQDVHKVVKQQLKNYAQNPAKYGLPRNVTLETALKRFDQTGAHHKIAFIKTKLPHINLKLPLIKLFT